MSCSHVRSVGSGLRKMMTADVCRGRAAECMQKAELVVDPIARSAWLKLAEQWVAFSQIPFYGTPQTTSEGAANTGLWRGAI